nr:hemicentin-1-like [Lepeophtheirus salmonis]
MIKTTTNKVGLNKRLKNTGEDNNFQIPEQTVSAIQGSSVDLPCNISAPKQGDKVRLVLWFKNDSSLPIYTYDTRGKSYEEASHWSDDKVLMGRAFFRGDHHPGRLVVDNVHGDDEGLYKCRVDYKIAPTKITNVHLKVIVPPEKPKVTTESGDEEIRLKLGPYRVGDNVVLKCSSLGGRPSPRVTWWRDHSLLDSSYESVTPLKVVNEITLHNLKREDLHTILTCQATNNNISVPVSTSVKLDMNFGPLSVSLLNGREPLSAGKRYEIQCQSIGARPQPSVTWWIGSKQIRNGVITKHSHDGNITVSSLSYVPSVTDAGFPMVCRAGVPGLSDSTKEDSWKLDIHYIPTSALSLGSSLNASNIKEGDDVYFECNVKSSPRPYKISWRHNGRELSHNIQKKVIISNKSLVLQKVTRADSGIYTCTAHNAEGDGESNNLQLDIRYKPFCKPNQVQVYGVAKHEQIRISCDVIANPSADMTFDWVFNTSSERIDLQQNRIDVHGSRSLAIHTPQTELDYGSLMCWGKNYIGKQEEPCVFHLIPAGKPDPAKNCSVQNQTYFSLQLTCHEGFDGGLTQTFTIMVKDTKTSFIVANTTNVKPVFHINGLRPGTSYALSVTSSNSKGASNPIILHAFTMKEAQKRVIQTPHLRSREFVFSPILMGLMIVGGALIIVFLFISIYFCACRRSPDKIRNRISYTETHVPLQKGIDDCIEVDEKNPDIIPISSSPRIGDCGIEEDGGFGVYGDKTRFATLQKQKTDYDTLRCIPSLSQEVTYAELSLPRGKGYTPMKKQSMPVYANLNGGGVCLNTSTDSSSASSSGCLKSGRNSSGDEGFNSASTPAPTNGGSGSSSSSSSLLSPKRVVLHKPVVVLDSSARESSV